MKLQATIETLFETEGPTAILQAMFFAMSQCREEAADAGAGMDNEMGQITAGLKLATEAANSIDEKMERAGK